MCDVPILVITEIVGFAIFVKRLISLKWFIPISITAASWSFKFNIVNGSPILLLLFPSVFKVLYFFESTLAITSLVLVFPTLPVTPTTGISYKLLLYFAISYNDSNTSFVFIIILFLYFVKSSLEKSISWAITALAPFSRACFQNLFPSKFAPFIATYVSFSLICLVSFEKFSKTSSQSPITNFPPVTFKMSFTNNFFIFSPLLNYMIID